MRIKTLSVSEVNNYIKKILDNDFILNNLSVKGEISNLKYHTSGHIYFSLKDSNGKINCVMFKGKAYDLDFRLEEGMEVVISASCSIYPMNGSLQLYCNDIRKEGLGELHIKFEKLKDKLLKKGYFDQEYKKAIPVMPMRIGVVTSETGAVIKDIINVTRTRSSIVDIVLYPAKVQGIGAYKSIIKGIKYFNSEKSVDLIIIGRGGGSIEELWNFNEEELALEIFKSNIPIISAVGHEVDFTISDFVSDLRASTPSQAAELAVPLESDMLLGLNQIERRINELINNRISEEKNKVNSLSRILKLNSPLNKIVNSYLEVDGLKERLSRTMANKIEKEKIKVISLNDILQAYNPMNILSKGYAIVQDNNKNVISEKEKLNKEIQINIILKDGFVKGVFNPLD
ncbi:exodeoxyribonuclease VII large subunit [Clostridium gasigenes]|uniref:Exodeoxyribonuclease 7 large subunit n=1 Tax=Clostridium gasigenes TaxID=94869 RepID=A0A1H0MZ34_9CLOT|nr:exodeoxyribonuclease VII large subunit [Clostridium gasigenes]MBB6625185.1 exodeoxyribonuclease VII large subunit [Clostridium gasigenes]MBU3087377.1 exodeoxyribonuclease VII large subunit [Clostridium gasigenes]MBU3102906.1 exodeoxyribonuclease VII large subunit [Clostridium gasigenes]MBU3135018.1 exodeoxyribonuclease VII large subunit [Clostridium gasigenes]SDO85719.1 Exodeoxyribonuclease VII large subunit [Clostridium gasigenes]